MGGERTAPAVVATVVTESPGAWLEECLQSLADQDYAELSVLVVTIGDGNGLAERVARAMPSAHITSVPDGTGYAAAANAGMARVSGAAHVLLCHDDVALAPDAVRLLLEEAYRSNAGLTCPKCVMWEAPDRLLSVGMGADRFGVTHPLVEVGELDQEQHDAAREVFVAPSGAVLVRADLWAALGGFNAGPGAGGPGEDLDLSWRAQLAGARVVVAPQARVRQRKEPWSTPDSEARLAREQHRLRTLWTCYSIRTLPLIVPLVVLFAVVEAAWALFHRRLRGDVARPLLALRRSFENPKQLRADRRRAQSLRRSSDLELWKSQSQGSARVKAVFRPRLEKGHELAWAAAKGSPGMSPAQEAGPPQLEDGAANLVGTARPLLSRPRSLGWEWTALTVVAVLALLAIGSRHLLTGGWPLQGQLPWAPATQGVGSWWHDWWSGTGTAGFGRTSFSPPGLALLGLVGTLGLGSATFALHAVVLGPLLLGPIGAYRGAGQLRSDRGRLVATVLYAALPLPFDAMANGHWAGLVAYAVAPWLLGGICRLGGEAPFEAVKVRPSWARAVALGLVLALAASLAPALLVLTLFIGAALVVGSLVEGHARSGLRMALAALAAVAVAFAVLAPWSLPALRSWSALMGSPAGSLTPVSVAHLLRLQTGHYGGGPLGWALIVAAVIPLLIGRSWRLAWAIRLWSVTLTSMALAWAASRGWFPAPSLELLLAPAGAALVYCVALGAGSVENDLSGFSFGWRQLAPPLGALAVVAAALPLVAWAAGGQWDLPPAGADSAYAFASATQGAYRVLWVGSAGTLPLARQGEVDGVSFAASEDGLPSASQLWAPELAGQAAVVAQDLSWAYGNETTSLGHLLSALAVRYVVVPAGNTASVGFVAALDRQVDLVPTGIDPEYQVYTNMAWAPLFTVLPPAQGHTVLNAAALGNTAWETGYQLQQADLRSGRAVVTAGANKTGRVTVVVHPGDVLYGAVPDGSWVVKANGHKLAGSPAGPGATAWLLPSGMEAVTLSPAGTGGQHLAALGTIVLWLVGLWAVITRRQPRRPASDSELHAAGGLGTSLNEALTGPGSAMPTTVALVGASEADGD